MYVGIYTAGMSTKVISCLYLMLAAILLFCSSSSDAQPSPTPLSDGSGDGSGDDDDDDDDYDNEILGGSLAGAILVSTGLVLCAVAFIELIKRSRVKTVT